MTRVALAYGAGASLPQAGVPSEPALLLLLLALPLALWWRPPTLVRGLARAPVRPPRSPGISAGMMFPGTSPDRSLDRLLGRLPDRVPPLPPALLLLLGVMAGVVAGESAMRGAARDCRLHLPTSAEVEVTGRFLGRPAPARGVPFHVEAGLPGGCTGTVRAIWPGDHPVPPTGARIHLPARWEGRGFPEAGRGEWAGRLRLHPGGSSVRASPANPGGPPPPGGAGVLGGEPPPHPVLESGPREWALALRGRILDRVGVLWPQRAPMVEALVMARREHLDPDLRAAFGLSGTAHLLAISGFHVGVVAGLLLAFLRLAGLHPRRSALFAALGAWGYVLSIGAPDAALRASVLLSLLALARIRGRPAFSVGTLSTAFLGLLVVDPGALRSVGFQLSFAGTLGLVTLRGPMEVWVDRGWRRLGRTPPRRRPGAGTGERWLRGSSEGLVAGIAATLPTLPFLAWHFDRISLVGIPATLAIAPWISLAIPGIGAALAVSLVYLPAAGFLAGGVDLLLAGVEAMVLWTAHLPGAAFWVSRAGLMGAGVGGGLAWGVLRRWTAGRIRPRVRTAIATLAGIVGVLLAPLAPGPATLDLHLIDVGQGDALALRLPDGGWVAVDAGPRSAGWDAGARRVVPYLRREGVRRLEALVLSHPHLDHIGGAPALLREFPVRGVLDPAHPVPSRPYLELQEKARDRGVSWWPAREGQVLRRRGVEIRVLHPDPSAPPLHRGEPLFGDGSLPATLDANDLSVVLLVSFGEAHLLLTGDAYAWVEEAILPHLPPLTVLKLGHHGSRTSTSASLLEAVRPRWALIPVGDGNRYGHPHPEVEERLERVGARVLRTDRDGSVRLRIRPDGRVSVRTGR